MFEEIEVVMWDIQSSTWIWLWFVLGYKEDNFSLEKLWNELEYHIFVIHKFSKAFLVDKQQLELKVASHPTIWLATPPHLITVWAGFYLFKAEGSS